VLPERVRILLERSVMAALVSFASDVAELVTPQVLNVWMNAHVLVVAFVLGLFMASNRGRKN